MQSEPAEIIQLEPMVQFIRCLKVPTSVQDQLVSLCKEISTDSHCITRFEDLLVSPLFTSTLASLLYFIHFCNCGCLGILSSLGLQATDRGRNCYLFFLTLLMHELQWRVKVWNCEDRDVRNSVAFLIRCPRHELAFVY